MLHHLGDESITRNFINGEFIEPRSASWLDVIEPATVTRYTRCPASNTSDVDLAVEAAANAAHAWARTPARERSAIMLRIADGIERHLDRLALAESIDTGKPIALARSVDIPRAAANFRFFATAILHARGDLHEMDGGTGPTGGNAVNYTLRRPLGVVGLISPWNLPLYLLTWKIAPAIAAGNACICKPSEVTPMTAMLLGEILSDAGLPRGVVNIVHGRGEETGGAIVTHPGVRGVSFTGSTRVGTWIGERCGAALKKCSLELGGKNPFVVFDDAELDVAVKTCVRASFANQGQICLCGSRLLVQRGIYEAFVTRFTERARAIKLGDPLDEQTQHGALVSTQHAAKVASYVAKARALRAEVLLGGSYIDADHLSARCAGGEGSAFFEPTILAGLPNDCDVIQDEIFGPVVTIQRFEDEAGAVRLANSTRYGLASSVWTTDLSRAHRVADAVDSGIVWINCWMVRDLRTPFGGTKSSGVGREGGDEAFRFFTEPKNVCVQL
ncbi:MAG: aldehyde dehydrogenase [Planctomycetota bacterium]